MEEIECEKVEIIKLKEQIKSYNQGIEENNNASLQVNLLYPNPNNGTFDLQIDGVIGDVVNCKLFNMQGQVVSEFKLGAQNGSSKNTIEMSKKFILTHFRLSTLKLIF